MYIPYEYVKQSTEGKVRNLQAQERSTLVKGTAETPATKGERALVTTGPSTLHAQDRDNANICSYCDHPRHNIRQCHGLEKDLRDGRVKAGTVLPANFVFKENSSVIARNNNRDFKGNNSGNKKKHGNGVIPATTVKCLAKDVVIPVALLLLLQSIPSQVKVEADPTWTINSDCTRHVSHESQWFTDITTSGGSITVGDNNQIPIEGIGLVKLEVSDSKGTMQKLIVHGVLFDRKQCALQTDQRFKIKALMSNNTDPYQFQAKSAVPPTALIASGTKP
ncbi:hypothetical protein PHMEG_00038077 [Phytophthora megakarya]|uniref:Retrovirus-related Pol polyprotein from transposon TNT 1-94-like beta-barrel domain-containing protein n=1 Tax=Phytophthora megakarya TaxID=4795 RepID=A0A225UKV3_9STRA|nr:hypothetical protein PHMEG_00038077 [Phytophthora megakarya]